MNRFIHIESIPFNDKTRFVTFEDEKGFTERDENGRGRSYYLTNEEVGQELGGN